MTNSFEDALFQQLVFACSETRQAFSDHIGMSQARTQLLTLVARTGEISHADVQQQLGLDGATITRLVKEFEAGGVLIRRLDPNDNRYTLVSLTAAGQQKVAELRLAHSQFESLLLVGITTDEQEIVASVLERLRANIRAVEQRQK